MLRQEKAGQSDPVALGHEAFERRSWAAAYSHLSAADASSSLDAATIERLAVAAFLIGHDREALDLWTRAHHQYLRNGQTLEAVRSAGWLAFLFMFREDMAQSSGWLARGRRLLEGQPENAAAAYLLTVEALRTHWSGDSTAARPMFEEIETLGRRFQEPNLLALGRLGLGDISVQLGDISGGMMLLDEVMAAVTSDDVSPLLVGIIYCAIMNTCQQAFDVRRATEWTNGFSQWCEAQPDLVPFRGECIVRRSELMQRQGAWPLAMEEIMRATESFTEDHFVPWAGDAFYQQAELHRLHGDYGKAEASYRVASQLGNSLQPGLALMRLAQGRANAAVALIRRLLGEATEGYQRSRLLPAHVAIMLETGDIDAAEASAQELRDLALQRNARYLQALAGHAMGSVMLARGDTATALSALRGSLECWHDFNMPYEAARARVLIAEARRQLGDDESAEVELAAARDTFARLGAVPDFERAQALIASEVTPAVSGALTERELDVLRLVAAGSSNRAIAETLVVSEHTVRRHLQNIFAKLDVSTRAAATAYAFQHDLI
jgi:DNA-binding CsgD family transcriptional regulator